MGFPPLPRAAPTPPQPHCGGGGGCAHAPRTVRIPAANQRPAWRPGWPITALRRRAEAIKGGGAAGRAWPALWERRKMAEGDNNSVYQLVRAGGGARDGGRSGLLGAAAGPGPPCPALLCPAVPDPQRCGARAARPRAV